MRPAHQSPLLTDLYELTMAAGYWHHGMSERRSVFHYFFRKHPFNSGYTLFAGLEPALEWLDHFRFEGEELNYLATLNGADGKPLFTSDFLEYLATMELTLDVDAMPEGSAVFPQEPIMRVEGPLIQAQLVETALLNIMNFESLIATKAARICNAAQGDPVVDFGLRRAQSVGGGLSGTRAAYIGGVVGTSNVYAGWQYGIPVKGTHAHSWVMCFEDEHEAFDAYAEAMPNNCIFLVDTYDTLQGVKHAIDVGKRLMEDGHVMAGIRLDSGDLAWLSRQARELLDNAGFQNTKILASNDLDEYTIESLKQQHAAIDLWGVGTRLITAYDQPALGGVYKLSAIQDSNGQWQYPIKLSENRIKITTPGRLQVRRYENESGYEADVIYHLDQQKEQADDSDEALRTLIDPLDPTRQRRIRPDRKYQDLLQPVIKAGNRLGKPRSLDHIRDYAATQLDKLHSGIRRHLNPHEYPVGLSPELHAMKQGLIQKARNQS